MPSGHCQTKNAQQSQSTENVFSSRPNCSKLMFRNLPADYSPTAVKLMQ